MIRDNSLYIDLETKFRSRIIFFQIFQDLSVNGRFCCFCLFKNISFRSGMFNSIFKKLYNFNILFIFIIYTECFCKRSRWVKLPDHKLWTFENNRHAGGLFVLETTVYPAPCQCQDRLLEMVMADCVRVINRGTQDKKGDWVLLHS